MIENILANLVNENALSAVKGNEAIPGDKKGLVAQAISDSLFNGLKDQVSQGNIAGILDIFSSNKTTSVGSTVMDAILSGVTSAVCKKTGLNAVLVQGIISSIIPNILGSLGKKANDSNDKSIDFNSILSSLGGSNLQGIDLNSMMGRLNSSDDKFDVGDVVNMFSNLADQNGGLKGMLGSLFGGK